MRLLILFILCSPTLLSAQKFDRFWVEFTDKNQTPYSLLQPQEFLSKRALDRRKIQGVPIDWKDLPCSPAYVQKIKQFGIPVYYTSKWMNGAVIACDSQQLAPLKSLSFVKSIEPISKSVKRKRRPSKPRDPVAVENPVQSHYHGIALGQISVMLGDMLHYMGYSGASKEIAVLDGGFKNLNTCPYFDSVFIRNQILETWDFVEMDSMVYEFSDHGTGVTSTIASNRPYHYVGSAPDANFRLFITEEVASETRIEEDNWVAAIERADSSGVDVVNSSLGYTRFTHKSMNYTFKDLNGTRSRASRAADLAYDRGILVVNSAGNSGRNKWKKIGVPADAFNVIAVGALNQELQKADFSSIGPTYDGRIKPNLSAPGSPVAVTSAPDYTISGQAGTSLASPILAGLATSLWSAFPEATNAQIKSALENSANAAQNPDTLMGYGKPDLLRAYYLLQNRFRSIQYSPDALCIWNHPNRELKVRIFDPNEKSVVLILKTISGEIKHVQTVVGGNPKFISIPVGDELRGLGYFHIIGNSMRQHFLIEF